MKALRIITIVLMIAVLGASFAACSSAKVKNEASQLAANTFLLDVNGASATEVGLDIDSLDIVEMAYITFTVVDDTLPNDKGFPMYAYRIVSSFNVNGTQFNNVSSYVNVIYKNENCSAKMGNADLYDKYQKQYNPKKEVVLKDKAVKSLMESAIENLKQVAASNKAAAERAAEEKRLAQEAMAALEGTAGGYVAAINGATITTETTREQLIALFPAASDTLVYIEDYSAEEDLATDVTYVLVPARPDAGYVNYTLTVFNLRYAVYIYVNEGVAEATAAGTR